MKIAVLLCAQPRFLNLTYKRIKEEYNIPNVQVDFFIHFWKHVSFSPRCERQRNYVVDDNLQDYINYLAPKKYKIDDYSQLDDLVFLFRNLKSFVMDDFIALSPIKDKQRYEFGQWFSQKKAYMLMEDCEKANNFKYDIVIKTKTDYIYSNKGDKVKNYIIPEDKLKTKLALVTNLKIQKFLHEKSGFKNYRLKEYIPGVTLKGDNIYENIRYDETYLRTLIFDTVNQLENNLQTNKNQDVLGGHTAIYNNIHLIGKQRRYIRLYLKDKCKSSWITNNSDISIDATGLNHYSDLDFYE